MVSYLCTKCCRQFKTKREYAKHLKRKTECVPTEQQIEKKRMCLGCNKLLNERKDNFNRHLNKCKLYQQININTNVVTNNTINNNQINNSQIICNFNIGSKIHAFEDSVDTGLKDVKYIITDPKNIIENYIQAKHFNENKKENHNICYSNSKKNYADVYRGNGKWEAESIINLTNKLIEKGYDKAKELQSSLSCFKEAKKKLDKFYTYNEPNDAFAWQRMRKSILRILLNGSDMVIATRAEDEEHLAKLKRNGITYSNDTIEQKHSVKKKKVEKIKTDSNNDESDTDTPIKRKIKSKKKHVNSDSDNEDIDRIDNKDDTTMINKTVKKCPKSKSKKKKNNKDDTTDDFSSDSDTNNENDKKEDKLAVLEQLDEEDKIHFAKKKKLQEQGHNNDCKISESETRIDKMSLSKLEKKIKKKIKEIEMKELKMKELKMKDKKR